MERKRLVWLVADWCTANPTCFTCPIKARFRGTRREHFPVLSHVQDIGYDLDENG
ncbi:MAG: hypothetical protein NTY19_39805 [Planctomycetota bacterium]|nr:hypothetical protein [Planctomycetota bacterium]